MDDNRPLIHVEYNDEGEPILVEDDGVVYGDNGLVDLAAMGISRDDLHW